MIALLVLACAQQELAAPAEWQRRLDGGESAAALAAEIQREAWRAHGSADGVLAQWQDHGADQADRGARARAFELLAELQFREGLLEPAVQSAARALEAETSVERLFLHARLLDTLDRTEAALEAFARLRAATEDARLVALVDRRVALIEAVRRPSAAANPAAQPPDAPSRLFTLAAGADADEETRSRAAIVLAMLGRPAEALRLYPAAGEGTARFRREIRLAEWALAAGDAAAAQEHAWQARTHAAVRRDRRYALAVLAEAHRADDSLARLLERFAGEPGLDEESRLAWIELLRETARVDEALALFADAERLGFTPEMRRSLLEVCREAGREEELLAAYRQLIAAEPRRAEWREGLSRHLLEHGRREEAAAIWEELLGPEAAPEVLLEVAARVADLGLDPLARAAAERALGAGEDGLRARLFLFEFEWRRGRIEAAERELAAFDHEADPRSPARVELAEAYERIGLEERAVAVLEGLRAARGGDLAEEDLEMRLAWLLSATGDEERALELWRGLWRSVESPTRRRQVEDRLLATAARLGVLADLAVELERKLYAGAADERDAALLVRLYQKVGDPVAAAEILEEQLKRAGDDPLRTLDEKARIYLAGKDYYHFERTVEALVALDSEHRSDRLRQLAMSMLERGKPQEARAVLRDLAAEEGAPDAAEFEAGVLALAQLDEEAILVYRKGLAAHPERIDSYLLLAEAMRRSGAAERATGMFQFLVETADQDDLFTVAVDGVLNMRAREPALRWTLRAILERLGERDDRSYLFQLAADLFEELEDHEGRMRALEASLPIAGEQRAAILRELMDLALGRATNTYTIISGRLVAQRSGGDERRHLAYGRRLIGLGDAVPPEVYLELGEAFLAGGEPANAAKTFALAREVPDWPAFQRRTAASFENARYVRHALEVYERLMLAGGADAGLLLKLGELQEELGRDARAAASYRAGLALLLDRLPLDGAAEREEEPAALFLWVPRNLDEHDTLLPELERGLLAASTDEDLRRFLAEGRVLVTADLARLAARADGSPPTLAGSRRVRERGGLLRRIALACGWTDEAEALDLELLHAFPADAELLGECLSARAVFGYEDAALRLAAGSGRPPEARAAALAKLGLVEDDPALRRAPLPDRAVRALLPLLLAGDRDGALRMLRSVDLRGVDRAALPVLQQLLSVSLYLEDPHLAAQLAQATLALLTAEGSDYEDASVADALFKRLRRVLDAEAYGLVVDGYVTRLLGEDDADRLQMHLRVVARLRRELGRELLPVETLRARLESMVVDRAYAIASLLELAAADQHLALVQPLWSRIPPAQRCTIALNLLEAALDEPQEPFLEFLSRCFLDGLEDVEDVAIFAYSLERALQRGSAALPWVEPLIEAVAAKAPEQPLVLAELAAARIERGRMGAALEAMHAAVSALGSGSVDETYLLYGARRILVAGFVPENAERLLAAVRAAERAGGAREALGQLRAEIYQALDDRGAALRAAEAAYREDPENLDKRIAYYEQLEGQGEIAVSMPLLERLASEQPADADWQRRFASRLRSLGDYARAQAVEAALASEDEPHENDERLSPPDLQRVREAAEAERFEEARAEYRRSWRSFGRADRVAMRVYSGNSYYSGTSLWPVRAAASAAPSDEEPSSGLAALRLDRDPYAEPRASLRQRTVPEALAGYDFGRAELARQFRGLRGAEIAASAPLLRGIELAEVATLGASGARAAWLARLQEGRAGARERGIYLAFLEHADPAALDAAERAALEGLAARLAPQDTQDLRALARAFAALGDEQRAERLYEWLSSLATAAGWTPRGVAHVSAREWIEEVSQVLSGAARERALAALLRHADPGGSSWERESFLRLSLDTWLGVAGAARAAEAGAAELAEILRMDRGLLRGPAIPAARIFADTGRPDDALRALEIAACDFAADEVRFPAEEAQNARQRLRAPQLHIQELLRVFPGGGARNPGDAAWLGLAAEAVLEWSAAARLHRDTARALTALLALRLHEAGAAARARALLDAFWNLPGPSPWERLLGADLERLLGEEPRARAEEDALLAEGRLDPHRVRAVLLRRAAEHGHAAALADGERLAEWMRHRRLLETLVELADSAGATDAAQRWGEELAAQQSAAAALGVTW